MVEIWECEFEKLCRSHPELEDIIDRQRPDFHRRHRGSVTEKQILRGICDGELFGLSSVICQSPRDRERF